LVLGVTFIMASKPRSARTLSTLLFGLSLVLPSNLSVRPSEKKEAKKLEQTVAEYCFSVSSDQGISMEKVTTFPRSFLGYNPAVLAVINGIYFGPPVPDSFQYEPIGIAYIDGKSNLAKSGAIRGYFTISKDGSEVLVSENMSQPFSDYHMVIGTHPLLVVDSQIPPQAFEERYNRTGKTNRSAIGTKDGRNVCFAVSEKQLTMQEWAEQLQYEGYKGALNLDGGSPSELAVRGKPSPRSAFEPTRLVIYSFLK